MAGKLIIFSAPSGAGKSTLVHHLATLDLGLIFSISATSRSPRKNETEGKDYYFITPGEFRRRIDAGEFLEWEEVYPGRYYGTPRSELERIWKKGGHALFDIDVMGGLTLKRSYPDRSLSVFVKPPSMDELARRLRERGTDDEESLEMRLEKAEEEMQRAVAFDRILVNDNLEKAREEAETVVRDFLGM